MKTGTGRIAPGRSPHPNRNPHQKETNMGAAHPTHPTRYTLTFDWPSPPLTANQRHHWRKKADITRKVRAAATTAARDIPFLDKIRVGMTWVVRTQHRRDVDNTVPTLKALCDGLVDADIVADDTPDFMAKTMPEIRYDPTAAPHLELWIEAIV